MGLRKILTDAEPALHKTCKPVVNFDERLHTLLNDMRETLIDSCGVGLAAPQVGILRRVVLVDVGDEILELVNPTLVETDGVQEGAEALVPIRSQTECKRTDHKVSLHKEGAGARSSKSTIYGFPISINRKGQWCQKLKTRFLDSPAARGGKNIVEYIGIAADEPARFGQLNERKRAPLVEFGIEEDLCGLYCMYENILSPSYESSCRDGCWMCHNQGVNQLRQLRKNYPDLWALLLKWDKDSPVNFHPDGHTVHDFDERFRLEDEGFIQSDKRFFWRMLNEPLQKSLF